MYNIERNKLDYILTDLLPVEITELFTLKPFYDYLIENKKIVDDALKKMKLCVASNKSIPFTSGWATSPLKFNILKGNDGLREISLMQPLSMLNIYLFLELYQKELLILLKENSIFSLRYHKKSTDLYYKKSTKKTAEYYNSSSKRIEKGALQQTGAYFKIHKFNSVSSFTGSKLWQQLNLKYKYFAKVDYKSCFDSIYTHVYKWVIEKNVVESKGVENSNLYIVIDRILQNINARSSNGVIVGPEFSRMIVEILLQHIDVEVSLDLLECGLERNKDYNVYRYVDDIYIFANSSDDIDKIISAISTVSHKYLIHLNELKFLKSETPFTLNSWLSKTRELADRISGLFYSHDELKNKEDGGKYLVRDGHLPIDKIKSDFNNLICSFPNEKRTIVSFALSTLLNNISKKKNGIQILKEGKESKAFKILELMLYIVSFCPCFEHVQKVISILVYINDEINLKNDVHKTKLQSLINDYVFIFERGNMNDLCNLLLFFKEYELTIPSNYEDVIFKKILKLNNPLLLANYLLYSKYYEPYHKTILQEVEKIIVEQIEHITNNEEMLHKEFWYVLVFCNCPFLSATTKGKIDEIINRVKLKASGEKPSEKLINLICSFLQSGHNNLFYTWGAHQFSVTKQIAFRTHQRSIFREYKHRNSLLLYGSLD